MTRLSHLRATGRHTLGLQREREPLVTFVCVCVYVCECARACVCMHVYSPSTVTEMFLVTFLSSFVFCTVHTYTP